MDGTQAPPVTTAPATATVRRTLGHLVQETARLMRRRFIQHAEKARLPLNQSEATVLRRLAREQGTNQASLAWALDIEPMALTRLLDHLQDMALIERRADPADRRMKTLWLTAAAEPVVASIRAVDRAVRLDALEGFEEAAHEALIQHLLHIRQNLMQPPPDTPQGL